MQERYVVAKLDCWERKRSSCRRAISKGISFAPISTIRRAKGRMLKAEVESEKKRWKAKGRGSAVIPRLGREARTVAGNLRLKGGRQKRILRGDSLTVCSSREIGKASGGGESLRKREATTSNISNGPTGLRSREGGRFCGYHRKMEGGLGGRCGQKRDQFSRGRRAASGGKKKGAVAPSEETRCRRSGDEREQKKKRRKQAAV